LIFLPGRTKARMNEEQNQEMFERIFNTEIFIVDEEPHVIHSFCLAERQAGKIKLLVMLNDVMNEKASPSDIELLNKIADFKEYHLTREEVVILNLAHQTVSLKQLTKEFSSPNILCFGISPSEIGLQIEARSNQPILFCGVNFIFTSTLHQISRDEKLKKQFFLEALKPMFSLSNQS
jgi:hypothetical protein